MNRDRATPEQAGVPSPSITGFVVVAVVALGSFLLLLLAAPALQGLEGLDGRDGRDGRAFAHVACGVDEPSSAVPWKPSSWTCRATSSLQPLQ